MSTGTERLSLLRLYQETHAAIWQAWDLREPFEAGPILRSYVRSFLRRKPADVRESVLRILVSILRSGRAYTETVRLMLVAMREMGERYMRSGEG